MNIYNVQLSDGYVVDYVQGWSMCGVGGVRVAIDYVQGVGGYVLTVVHCILQGKLMPEQPNCIRMVKNGQSHSSLTKILPNSQ